MSKYEFYLVEKKPPVAWVYLNRPEKKNAMNLPAFREPVVIFDELDRDPEIRVVVLAAKGDCFSAGIDLIAMAGAVPEIGEADQKGGIKWRLLPKIREMQDANTCIERCRKPVIAAVHGYCIGAGLDMITACDIRLCSEDAIFSLREAAVGFVCDLGSLQRIPLIVGQGIARELAYTAKNITALRAREILLVSEVYKTYEELMAGAAKMAADIAANPPIAVQASKTVLNYGVGKSVGDGLEYVASLSANVVPSNDLIESFVAFSEKRKPRFTGS